MDRPVPEFVDRVSREDLGYTRDPYVLFDSVKVSNDPSTIYSLIVTPLFHNGVLYLYIDSTGTSTHYITVQWQYWDGWSKRWYDLAENFWAALTFEDVDTASGLARCYHVRPSGKSVRLKITCTNGSASAYFTVSAYLDLYRAARAE